MHIFLLIYVDDLIVTGNFLTAITHLIECLKQSFSFKDLGSLHYFLDIHVQPLAGSLHLSQSKYILDVLECAKLSSVKPAKIPIPASSKLSQHNGNCLQNPVKYRQIVGALQ
jgi:hypothetical protein